MQKIQIIFLVYFFVAAMTDSEPPSTEAKVYIVHTENPQDQQPEEFHIKTLASVLGSEDAAKEALIYSYKHAASGFAAKLTPEQVSELAIVMRVEKDFQASSIHLFGLRNLITGFGDEKPGVLQIVPSKTLHLHGPERM